LYDYLYSINPQNQPTKELEQDSLKRVVVDSIRPNIKHPKLGQKTYFKRILLGISVKRGGWVNAHNGHPISLKNDFALNDIIGQILVSF
jgi:hypothetical protein